MWYKILRDLNTSYIIYKNVFLIAICILYLLLSREKLVARLAFNICVGGTGFAAESNCK